MAREEADTVASFLHRPGPPPARPGHQAGHLILRPAASGGAQEPGHDGLANQVSVFSPPGINHSATAVSLRIQTVLTAVIVFGLPFVLFYRLILFHFYVRGSFLLDSGLLASLIWHNTAAISLPPSLGGHSFYIFHVAPVLSLASTISNMLPVTMPQMFAGFIGLSHGLLALAMFWLLVQGHGMRRGLGMALAALASVAFAFNGLALAIARYPHFEIFGAACLLLFLVALAQQRHAIAVVAFLAAIATREDIGLHAFGFLAVWLAINWLRGVHEPRNVWLGGFAIAALTYSMIASLSQHLAYPNASTFVRVYLGEPVYSHVSASLLATRLGGWLVLHSAILLPAAAALVWAERRRDPFILAGYVACVPWAVLHLLAASELAGWMVGYYAYPFLIAMAWPWLAGVTPARREPKHPLAPAVGLMLMVVLSLLPFGRDYDPGRIALPEAFLHAPSAEQQRLTDRAIASIASARTALGRLVVDNSVASLAPLAFSRAEIAGWEEAPANTVVFFEDGFDSARLRAVPGLPVHYAVAGTAIRIMTDRLDPALRDIWEPK